MTEFYKSAGYKGGYTKRCKSCTKKKAREREEKLKSTPEGLAKERARHREKYHRLSYKEKHKPTPEMKKAAMERYKNKFPEKQAARNKTSHMKPEVKGNHLHHWSYNEDHYKDVIELSELDHNKLHRYMTYDQERMMYRTTEGVLLDTKKAHLEYFKSLKDKE